MKTLKKVTLDYKPLTDEVLRVTLKVERNVPYISSEWPSRLILWLSRRYHVTSAIFALEGDNDGIAKESDVKAIQMKCKEHYVQP